MTDHQNSSAATEDRKTQIIPDGYEAVRDAEGRATGEVRKIPTDAQASGDSGEYARMRRRLVAIRNNPDCPAYIWTAIDSIIIDEEPRSFPASQPSPAATVETPAPKPGNRNCKHPRICEHHGVCSFGCDPRPQCSAGNAREMLTLASQIEAARDLHRNSIASDLRRRHSILMDLLAGNVDLILSALRNTTTEPQEVKDPRIALLETLAKKSRTGVSFDWSPETGYRLMTFHNLRDGCKSISECLERELASQVSRPQSRSGKVCAYSDGCPPDGPVCHLCAHLQPTEGK